MARIYHKNLRTYKNAMFKRLIDIYTKDDVIFC